MSLVIATETALVRILCGGPDTTEISDATISSMFSVIALDWLNRRRPNKTIDNFATVAAQQDYDEKPAAAYYITKVWWLRIGWVSFSSTIGYVPDAFYVDNQLAGFSVMNNPAIMENFYKAISYFEDFFQGTGKEVNGKIRLIPVACGTGDTVFFEYTSAKHAAITAVEDEFKEGVRTYVSSLVMQFLSTKRGVLTGGRNWSGGGGRNEAVLAKAFEDKAEGLVPEYGFAISG